LLPACCLLVADLLLANRACVCACVQIQDDYLDCFGDPEVIGKIGTDIQDNKCSWLVVQALQRASEEQKAVIEASYGKDEDEAVQRVKSVYRELDLEGVFKWVAALSRATLLRACGGSV
jgi:farnesyl diphosphate synthase